MKSNKLITIFVTEPRDIAAEAILMLKKEGYDAVYSVAGNEDEIVGIFMRTYTKVTKSFLKQFPNIKFILRSGVGLENIDLEECKKRNISIFNAPGSNANAVAEYIVTVILMSIRKLPIAMQKIKKGGWREKNFIGEELKSKTVGLVGCGAIGKLLAQKLKTFDVRIIGYDPYVDEESLKELGIYKCDLTYLIQNSDIISLQLPLTLETKGMFSIREFSKMKNTSIFINISRGELINEQDLLLVLKNKIIASAVLDVFINEPKINKEILQLDNLLATPHIAGFTQESYLKMSIDTVKNFLKEKI